MACYNIMSILVNHRSEHAKDIQGVLTNYGCNIKMRLGLHEAGNVCAEEGLIILQLADNQNENEKLQSDLNSLSGVKAKTMSICSE